jgi:hypothetical protein
MIESILAGAGLITCIALGVHMALPQRLRWRVDSALRRLRAQVLRASAGASEHWRQQRRSRLARLEAQEVIRRARDASARSPAGPDTQPLPRDGSWEGNVYRPKQFDRPDKPH